jgi:hypothetical protein
MGDPELRFDFGREHRAGIDPAGLIGELAAAAAEDLAEAGFADCGNLADLLQLILVEPEPDVLGNVGEDGDWVRREELGFFSRWDGEVGEVSEVGGVGLGIVSI